MSRVRSSWLAGACAWLAACQVVTGLSELSVVDAGAPSSRESSATGSASLGDTAEPRDAAADSGEPDRANGPRSCEALRGVRCDLVSQCGCAAEQHCQAVGRGLEARCMKPGSLARGSVCAEQSQCPRGQTCDDHVCRDYCRTDADCQGGGVCVAAQSGGPKSSGVNVCWRECQTEDPSACAEGARCRSLQPERGPRGQYCAAPASPCPFSADGRCDEAKGSGECAEGTDTLDCECLPKLPDASCDLVAQCGCAQGQACVPVIDSDQTSAGCVPWSGAKLAGDACLADGECAPGQLCRFGSCSRLCDDDAQCEPGGACLPIDPARREASVLKSCYRSCQRTDPLGCGGESRCAHFDQRFAAQGDFCLQPRAECYASDGVCDEARGTGLCAVRTDIVDCCQPSLASGECDLVLQCGCESKPGTSCVEVLDEAGLYSTRCQSAGSVAPNNWCSDLDSCQRGAGCFAHVCRAYCSNDQDCADGGRCVVTVRDGVSTGIKACLGPCSPDTNLPCGPNTVCTSGTIERAPATGCTFEPLTAGCPTMNGRCDEPAGTGICAPGSDPEDCA